VGLGIWELFRKSPSHTVGLERRRQLKKRKMKSPSHTVGLELVLHPRPSRWEKKWRSPSHTVGLEQDSIPSLERFMIFQMHSHVSIPHGGLRTPNDHIN
jgi:hypothetical protein